MALIADICLDEYTDHGHCGLLDERGEVANDPTLAIYGRIALARAKAGADLVGPSGMMDGQVAAIREALDGGGYSEVGIFAYARVRLRPLRAFPGSGGRDVRWCRPASHQQDPRNLREALKEVELDVAEGADIVMVKPALSYLDVIAAVRQRVQVPLGAYHVSGKYSRSRPPWRGAGWTAQPGPWNTWAPSSEPGRTLCLHTLPGELAELLNG